MRVAALYDIHGNLPALEAVLEDVRAADIDLVLVGGDVLPGPMPIETLTCLLDLEIPSLFLVGNGDREVLARRAGTETDWYRTAREEWREPVRWTAERLRADHRRTLASWPDTCRVAIPGQGEVLFCHATPGSDTEIFTRLTPEDRLVSRFEEAGAAIVICGHTHMQFDRTIGRVRVVNAGSVGMPFGEPGAYWASVGSTVELRRTAYDLRAAAERICATDYPQAEEFAKRSILRPKSEKETLAMFSRVEIQ
jgi:predicted phosphodiesterase